MPIAAVPSFAKQRLHRTRFKAVAEACEGVRLGVRQPISYEPFNHATMPKNKEQLEQTIRTHNIWKTSKLSNDRMFRNLVTNWVLGC